MSETPKPNIPFVLCVEMISGEVYHFRAKRAEVIGAGALYLSGDPDVEGDNAVVVAFIAPHEWRRCYNERFLLAD